MNQLVRLLSDLVAIPSMNPMGRDREGEEYSEHNIAQFVAAYMKNAGIDTEIYEIAPGRPNVEGWVDSGCSETLLLEAHLDTVHADRMTIDPFRPVIDDGKLYGRGACDTKGSIASFLHAVASALEHPGRLRYNIRFLFVSDEEYRFAGAREAVRRGLKATFGIAGEPTSLALVRAHKGVTRWKINARGVASHSAYPERGANAIYRMAEVIKRLEQHGQELLNSAGHPSLGTPTLSVGVIEGGQAVNVVPDACWIEVDRRSLPDETSESVLRPVKDLLKDLPDVEIAAPHISVAGMDVPEDSPIVQLLGKAVKHTLANVEIASANYATDAGVYNSVGIPAVVFGPGNIAQAHTDSEFISVSQLEQAALILKNLISV